MNSFLIREATPADAESFLALLDALETQTSFLLFEPGERTADVAVQRERFRAAPNRRERVFVGELEGRLIGYLGMRGLEPRRVRHVATFAMGVHRDAWRKGVGQALLARGETWAREIGICRIEMTVLYPNLAARSLYVAAGYVPEGVRRHAMRVDGQFVDEVYMAKSLDVGNR